MLSQYVVQNPIVKSLIHHGTLHGIFTTHLEWRQSKERPELKKEVQKHNSQWDINVRAVAAACVMCTHSLELTTSWLNTDPTEPEYHFDGTKYFPEELDNLARDELLETIDLVNDASSESLTIDKQLVQLNAVKPQRSMPFILSDAQVRLSLGSSLALLITSSLLCRSAVQCSFLSAFGTAVWCSQSAMFTTARSVQCTDTALAALY